MKYIHLITAITTITAIAISAASAQEKKNIVDTAVEAGNFKTLAAALKAAGLVKTLNGKGPFTVFAPTDAAFAKLPKGTVEDLLKPANKGKLTDILTYHVVSGKIPSKIAVTLSEANAINNKKLNLKVKGKSLFLNQSKVTAADVDCKNGVIHVIDTVLLPPAVAKGSGPKTSSSVAATPKAAGFTKPTPKDLIHSALIEGGNMYNHDNIGATSAIYSIAAKALLMLPDDAISKDQRNHLSHALHSSRHHGHSDKAWVLYQALSSMQ